MLRTIFIIITTLLLGGTTACAAPVCRTDLELQPYVDEFHGAMIERGIIMQYPVCRIVFGSMSEEGTAAFCQIFMNLSREVVVSEKYRGHTKELRWIIFHELGHCILNKEHSDNPIDIMYPIVPDSETLTEDYWDIALSRFFTRLHDTY